MIGDVTSSALHSALTGLAQRQRVTADNIANLQTPGFLAGRVDFETGLRGALASGQTPTASTGTVRRSMEPTRLDGNNVNLDAETVIATETGCATSWRSTPSTASTTCCAPPCGPRD